MNVFDLNEALEWSAEQRAARLAECQDSEGYVIFQEDLAIQFQVDEAAGVSAASLIFSEEYAEKMYREKPGKCKHCKKPYKDCDCDDHDDAAEGAEDKGGMKRARTQKLDLRPNESIGKLPPRVLARIEYGEAQRGDVLNRNRRIYADKDMPHAVEHADKYARTGQLFSLGGHPTPGVNPQFSSLAGVLRAVKYEHATGKVGVTLDLLAGEQGEMAVNALRAGAALPISSRTRGKAEFVQSYEGRFGKYGALESDKSEPILLIREYRFGGWDVVPTRQGVKAAVYSPGQPMRGAAANESLQSQLPAAPKPVKVQTMDIEKLKKDHPEVYAQVVAEAEKPLKDRISLQEQVLAASRKDSDSWKALCESKDAEIIKLKPAAPKQEVQESEEMRVLRGELARLQKVEGFRNLSNKLSAKIKQSPFGFHLERLAPALIISEANVPKDEAELNARFEAAETLVEKTLLLERARVLGGDSPTINDASIDITRAALENSSIRPEYNLTPSKQPPAKPGTTEHTEDATSNMMGDF